MQEQRKARQDGASGGPGPGTAQQPASKKPQIDGLQPNGDGPSMVSNLIAMASNLVANLVANNLKFIVSPVVSGNPFVSKPPQRRYCT